MPEYTLRNIDPLLWSQFTDRASREGWPTRALIVRLLEAYAGGNFTPPEQPPRELPQFAWLRAHFRLVAQEPGFAALEAQEQWRRLTHQVAKSPAGASWTVLNEVPADRRAEILRWLRHTSNISGPTSLTLRAIAHIGHGPDLLTNRRAFQYEVLGLPSGQQAWIADFGGGWRVLRVVDAKQGEWGEPHLSKEDALNTLAEVLAEVS